MTDGATKFRMVADLRAELHADGCTDERGMEILAEIRKIESGSKPRAVRKPKVAREQYMTVMGGYVLDMHQQGKLVGHRTEDGGIYFRP